jgi:hypothetical protein
MTALVLAVVQTSLLDPAASVTLSKILSADMHERAARFAVWGTAAGAVVYALAGRALPLRRLLPVAIVLATAAQLVFVSMLAPASAVLACAIAGVGYALLECALLHLTMRAAPTGHEAFVFTVLVGAHAIGRTSFLIVAMRFLGTGDMSAAPAVAIVAGAVALLATRLLPREVVDPHA